MTPCRTPEHLEWIASSPIKAGRCPGISWNDVTRDIATEIAQRRRLYPDRVARGQMSSEEADYQIAIFGALAADVARIMANACDQAPAHRYSRAARIDALLRERSYRQRLYPKWVTTGQISADQATHRTHCLDALLERFDEGLDWVATNGKWISDSSATPAEIAATRAELEQLSAIYNRRWHGEQAQEQLAL